MEKSKPLELGLDLLKNYGIVENNECRFISHERTFTTFIRCFGNGMKPVQSILQNTLVLRVA